MVLVSRFDDDMTVLQEQKRFTVALYKPKQTGFWMTRKTKQIGAQRLLPAWIDLHGLWESQRSLISARAPPAAEPCQDRTVVVDTESMVLRRIQAQRRRGRSYQPRFATQDVILSWAGGLLAITALGLISAMSHYPLVVAPFGASTVLLFGYPSSPLSQPRNIVLGNTLAAVLAVGCVAGFGSAPWVMGLAVGGTIAVGQQLRCLHPPAGAVALLGVLLKAQPGFVVMPVMIGSLLLTLMAVLFSQLRPQTTTYPHHWF